MLSSHTKTLELSEAAGVSTRIQALHEYFRVNYISFSIIDLEYKIRRT